MPLQPLYHHLIRTQTPSSALRPEVLVEKVLEPDYFDSIDLTRSWAASKAETFSHATLNTSNYPRALDSDLESHSTSTDDKGKLLVCHDFKGGYTENSFERGYSFEFWHLVDSFIYFSHNRVTIPPRGWVDAGHRHGSKVFGTVIFEWAESKPDLALCLYDGATPIENTASKSDASSISFCTTYASHLITLAQARGFDGYLLNIETDLNFLPPAFAYPNKLQSECDEDAASFEREGSLGGIGALISSEVQQRRAHRMEVNARALLGWVGWLRMEGKRRIGAHWEIIWYDSVTTAGQLNWQDALTAANAPFFVNSDAIFTNYTWARPPDPAPPGALQEAVLPPKAHHPSLLQSSNMAESLNRSRSDVYIGIDVFGRNCYGGFDIGRSFDMIFPSRRLKHLDDSRTSTGEGENPYDLGLSVALFAPGWTWEREKDGGGERSWNEWWQDELQFWIGRASLDEEPVGLRDEAPASVGSFFGPRHRSVHHVRSTPELIPIVESAKGTSLLPSSLPIHPSISPEIRISPAFYTNFNRGAGASWWVRGRKVYHAELSSRNPSGKRGWTDMGSCFPKPDRIWPRPVLLHFAHGDRVGKTGALDLSRRRSDEYIMSVQAVLADEDVWEGGTSLEIMLRVGPYLRGTPLAESPVAPSITFTPLCTLHSSHLASSQSLNHYLEVVVKPVLLPAGATNFHELQLRPCLLWTDTQPGGRGSYQMSHPLESEPGQIKIRELVNGWYSITVVVQSQDVATPTHGEKQATDIVPVFALGFTWPPPRLAHANVGSSEIKLIVGAVSFSALPQAIPIASSPGSAGLAPGTASSQVPSPSRASENLNWKPVPRPAEAPGTSVWGVLTWGSSEAAGGEFEHGEADALSSYFNVFAAALRNETVDKSDSGGIYHPDVWLGTSTYESDCKTFVVAGLERSDLIPGLGTHYRVVGGEKLPFELSKRVCFRVERVGPMSRVSTQEEAVRHHVCEVEL